MQALTLRQQQILEFIRTSIRLDGRPPTIREIAGHFGYSSPRSVQTCLDALERKGYIDRRRNVSRGIRLLEDEPDAIAVIGRVAAGNLTEAIQNSEFDLPIRASAFGETPHFALRITGDSMIDAGMLDGDFCIVRSQQTAVFGEIVVAMMDGEATVKRLVLLGNGKIGLKPENAEYSIRAVSPDRLRIIGVVKGVWRAIK